MTKTFQVAGTFQSLYAAQSWCEENGFSYGSLCCPDPVGIVRGNDILIAKWRNLTPAERNRLDGKMTSDDFREGAVTVAIKE